MKCLTLVVLLLTTVSALAQDKAAKEPAALVKERAAYEAKIKAVIDPITAKYLKKLSEMKKEFGGKGDLASAQAVQKEIERLTNAKNAVTIVGKWAWGGGTTVEFQKDGNVKQSSGPTGKWTCWDQKTRRYQASWTNGYTDWLLLSSDGMSLDGKNNQGDAYSHQKIEEE